MHGLPRLLSKKLWIGVMKREIYSILYGYSSDNQDQCEKRIDH
jgi:hypothetical protein